MNPVTTFLPCTTCPETNPSPPSAQCNVGTHTLDADYREPCQPLPNDPDDPEPIPRTVFEDLTPNHNKALIQVTRDPDNPQCLLTVIINVRNGEPISRDVDVDQFIGVQVEDLSSVELVCTREQGQGQGTCRGHITIMKTFCICC
jgi:hypothetical protein